MTRSSSSPRKRRRTKSPAKKPAKRRRVRMTLALTLTFLVGFVIAGVAVLKWAETPRGQMHRADRGLARAEAGARQHLHDRVLDALSSAGVPPDSISVGEGRYSRVATVRVGSTLDLLDLNVILTKEVEAAGGRVHRGVRHDEGRSATLEMQVGTRKLLTHRILAHWGEDEVEVPPLPTGRLAIVIDDWGHNLGRVARRILALPAPLTVAILPERAHSRRVLTEAKRAGKHVLLHLPMQPDETAETSPGDPAIEVGMDEATIERITERYLDGLPGVQGVNNHMGSLVTAHRSEMEAVMQVVARRGLMFLDSMTTSRSVAFEVARDFGVPTARNDLFMDVDTEDPEVVEERLRSLVDKARQRGWAVGIGHVNEAVASALERVVPDLAPDDVQLVFLSDLVHAPTP
jgi:polysaccharide deacetylase 2 family uncharacterized protein YibQ